MFDFKSYLDFNKKPTKVKRPNIQSPKYLSNLLNLNFIPPDSKPTIKHYKIPLYAQVRDLQHPFRPIRSQPHPTALSAHLLPCLLLQKVQMPPRREALHDIQLQEGHEGHSGECTGWGLNPARRRLWWREMWRGRRMRMGW